MNLADTVIPNSNQLNADDLLAAPRVVKITSVKVRSGEQPVVVNYDGDSGRPYLPGKSMRRVLIAMWGPDGANYVGKRLKLYADPSVKFGGAEVGGIRISHASGLTEPFKIMLTKTRGKKDLFTVDPLPEDKAVDLTPYEQTGKEMAGEGVEKLKTWFLTLPAPIKTALKTKLDSDWKPIAEAADKEAGK